MPSLSDVVPVTRI